MFRTASLIAITAALATPAQSQETVDTLAARTALIEARTALEKAQIDRASERLALLGLKSDATGKTDITGGGGEFEGWLLSARAIETAARMLNAQLRELNPGARPLVLLAADEPFDMGIPATMQTRLAFLLRQTDVTLAAATCGGGRAPTGAPGMIAPAAIAGIGALVGSFRTDTPLPTSQAYSLKAAFLRAALWEPAETITIQFLGGSEPLRARVRAAAEEWLEHANVEFSFVGSGAADIRVAFMPGEGSWSYVGTACRRIPATEPTMNFGWLDDASSDEDVRSVVLHEFGHALGLIHEHQNPKQRIRWNRDAVINDLSGPPNNWDDATIEHNMFRPYSRVQIGDERRSAPAVSAVSDRMTAPRERSAPRFVEQGPARRRPRPTDKDPIMSNGETSRRSILGSAAIGLAAAAAPGMARV